MLIRKTFNKNFWDKYFTAKHTNALNSTHCHSKVQPVRVQVSEDELEPVLGQTKARTRTKRIQFGALDEQRNHFLYQLIESLRSFLPKWTTDVKAQMYFYSTAFGFLQQKDHKPKSIEFIMTKKKIRHWKILIHHGQSKTIVTVEMWLKSLKWSDFYQTNTLKFQQTKIGCSQSCRTLAELMECQTRSCRTRFRRRQGLAHQSNVLVETQVQNADRWKRQLT